MTTFFTNNTKKISAKFSEFALNNIAPLNNLHKSDEFPFDLWGKMGKEGLLGLGIPREYNGSGGNALSISLAAHALVKNGNNLGIVLSWLLHQLSARYILDKFATKEQKEEYLPKLASGDITACFAVSEPKTGAHPKYIKTLAEEHQDAFTLNGEKTYLTNGPIADIFIIIAVTGIDSGKKQFSAFIVPKNSKGLELSEPIKIPFFRPAPHGGIILHDCSIPKSSLIGNKDTIYEDLVLPFRDTEDALMMGAVTGALEKQIILLAELFKKNNIKANEFLKMELGKLKTMLDMSKFISYEAAKIVDSDIDCPEKTSLLLYFRNLAKDYHVQIEIILKNAKLKKSGLLEILTNELAASASLGGNAVKIKQMRLGASLFS